MQELEKHMSFKKQVQTEGKALAELKEKYIHVSNVEKKHSEGLQTLKNLHNKTLSNLNDLNNIQERLKSFDSELSNSRSKGRKSRRLV